jgi:hypothetical protein
VKTIDLETGLDFDIRMTDTAIYPYYERLTLSRTETYRVFSSNRPRARVRLRPPRRA